MRLRVAQRLSLPCRVPGGGPFVVLFGEAGRQSLGGCAFEQACERPGTPGKAPTRSSKMPAPMNRALQIFSIMRMGPLPNAQRTAPHVMSRATRERNHQDDGALGPRAVGKRWGGRRG